VLGRLRLRIAEIQKLTPAAEIWDFLWVTDFPLFEWSPEENKWNAMHHPFTRPKAEDMPLFEAKKFPDVRAEAYDVGLNGVEIGGGSMRIYERSCRRKCSKRSASGRKISNPNSGICFGRCVSARRRTAASRPVSIG
jgi:aspartyl-tRNA synthetase